MYNDNKSRRGNTGGSGKQSWDKRGRGGNDNKSGRWENSRGGKDKDRWSSKRGGKNDNNRRGYRENNFKERGRGQHSYGMHDSRYGAKEWRHQNEPAIPDTVKASDLDKEFTFALQSLDQQNADTVARHLVMAGSLIDVDPEAAYLHAHAAVTRAGRIGIVREGAALAAYACGKYSEALREVRASRRLTGTDSLRAVEADCERGMGRPEKALEIIANTDTGVYTVEETAELVIVEAGARSDMGQLEAALLVIEGFLENNQVENETTLARVLSVKADLLEELDRADEAEAVREDIPEVPDEVSIMDLEEILHADMTYVRSDLHGCRKPLVEHFDGVLIDLDGVCYQGNTAIEHVSETLDEARNRGMVITFVTNNASRTAVQVADKLNGLGIEAETREIMTAAMDAVGILQEKLPPAAKVLVIGGEGLREPVSQAGFEIVSSAEDRPAAVIQGLDESIGWKELSEAIYAINAGAVFVATNLDATLPTERGFAAGNGALVKAVSHATGVEPLAGGKPFASIYRKAQADARIKHPLCIGDRLDTDIAGARAAGYRSLHVLTGVNDARAVALAPSEHRPSFVGLNLTSLLEPHPGPVKQPTELWTCGESAGYGVDAEGNIWCEENRLEKKATLLLNDYRALLAAVWEAKDNGMYVRVPILEVVETLPEE